MKKNTDEISITDETISEFLNKFTNDLDTIINNDKSNPDNIIDKTKKELINKTTEIMNNLLNTIKKLQKENEQTKKKYDKYQKNGEIKKKFFENQIKNLYKKDSQSMKKINKKNDEISKLKADLINLKNKYDEEINNLKNEHENLNMKYEFLEKKHKKIIGENSELIELNKNSENIITELEKENNEINNLLIETQNEIKNNNINYQKKLEEMQNEIVDLNNELDEREQDFQEYKNKYEKELKRSKKLEQRINQLLTNKELDNDYMTEYKIKKRKIPSRINTERNRNNDEFSEKKLRYFYRTIENYTSRNHSKKSHNSAISAISNSEKIKEINNTSGNKNNNKIEEIKTINNILYRSSTSSGFKQLIYKHKNNSRNEENNSNNNEMLDENSTNMNSNSSIKLTPENYSFIKLYQLNSRLKWCLFKKNKNKGRTHTKGLSMGNELLTQELDMYNYSDFIWMPYKTSKDFPEFREISSFVDSYELKNDKNDEIENLKLNIKNLENIISDKSEENKKLNRELSNLILENKKYKIFNEKLKEENYKIKMDRTDKNFCGVSIIADDPENSKFLDDKCCEDILTGLEKNPNRNTIPKKSCYNEKLKYYVDLLTSKNLSSNEINILSAILGQLGCSNEDINKLVGKYRGVITNPFIKSK